MFKAALFAALVASASAGGDVPPTPTPTHSPKLVVSFAYLWGERERREERESIGAGEQARSDSRTPPLPLARRSFRGRHPVSPWKGCRHNQSPGGWA